MMTPMLYANVLLITSISFLFLLVWTNSIRGSISLTQIIITVIIACIFYKIDLRFVSLLVTIFSISSLVWREIPHDKKDKWEKA